jgi:putative hydrolase of the HAD superfamily
MKSIFWDAVIFDYGGVLSYPPLRQELAGFALRNGLNESSFFDVYSSTRDYYGRSRVEYHQRWRRVADAIGVDISSAFVEAFMAFESDLWVRPNRDVLALARAVKQRGLKTAILSNMTFDLLRRLRESFDWLEEFEVQIWSCEVSCAKPDAAIYRECLAALGCDPARALFFDDRPRNVEGAKSVGMDARIFESAEQARAIWEGGMNPD